MNDRIFWQLIRRARERRGLSQAKLAATMGIAQKNFADWESGRVAVSEDTLIKIAAALGTTLRALLLEELVIDALAKPGPVKARTKKIEKIG